MKAKASLVRTDRTVELYAVSCVYMSLSLIIYHGTRNFSCLSGSVIRSRSASLRYFSSFASMTGRRDSRTLFNSLMEFRFCRILLYDKIDYFINVRHVNLPPENNNCGKKSLPACQTSLSTRLF